MSSERSYLDGVPLRLSAKFFPIPPMQFKDIDIHIPIDALQEDYDFSLERSAIAEAKAWEEQRLRNERESQERLKEQNEEMERLAERMSKAETGVVGAESKSEETSLSELEEEGKGGVGEGVSESRGAGVGPQSKVSSSQSSDSVPTEEEASVASRVEASGQPGIFTHAGSRSCALGVPEYIQTYRQDIAGAVLQPQPQILTNDYESKGSDRVVNKDSDHSYHQSITPASKINLNLSDFESDTANPFDNVELKSINDMEVLASVLQKNNSVTAPVPQNEAPSRTVNMNYVNGVTCMGYNSEQSQPMYFPSSSYPNQNFCSPWAPSAYYSPIVPSITSSPAAATQTLSTNLESPLRTQPPISTQSANLPPNSINSFTRFYFPLLTSMANSRANRERNVSPYGALPSSDVYGNPGGGASGMGQTSPAAAPLVNQNPISTPVPTMYVHNSAQHRLVASHNSPSQHYWADGQPQIGTNPYVSSNHRLSSPYPNEASLASVNSSPSFQNASSLSTSPKGSHPTLH